MFCNEHFPEKHGEYGTEGFRVKTKCRARVMVPKGWEQDHELGI